MKVTTVARLRIVIKLLVGTRSLAIFIDGTKNAHELRSSCTWELNTDNEINQMKYLSVRSMQRIQDISILLASWNTLNYIVTAVDGILIMNQLTI